MKIRDIVEEAYRNREMLGDPVKADEWMESLEFRIQELIDNNRE